MVVGQDGAPWSARLIHALEESDITFALSEGLAQEPTVDDAEKLRQTWIAEGCDSFVALGDGTAIDAVKAAAAGAAFRSRSILSLVGAGKIRRNSLPPVIAIPVVAGSGAESAAWAAVSDERGGSFVLEDQVLMPAYVILDPELLGQMSRETLARGVADGVCLSVEAYLSGYGNDATRALAAEALKGFFEAAEPCWNSGGTMGDRNRLLFASHRAGTAASAAGFGYARALSHSVQRVCGGSEGDICAVVLPTVLEKYGNPVRKALADLAVESGAAESGSTEEKAALLIARIRQLTFRIGLPEYLENARPAEAEEIGDLAAAEANPRYASPVVWTAADCAAVIQPLCTGE